MKLECGGCGSCTLCKLAAKDARYAALFGLAPVDAPPGEAVACVHRGDELRGTERDRHGVDHRRMWFHCEHPEQPLGAVVCPCRGCGPGCRGYAGARPVPGVGTRRHLLLHAYPRREGRDWWRWHAREMGRRAALFNGRRVVAIAHDADTDPDAAGLFGWADEIIDVRNDPERREGVSLPLLLEAVRDFREPGDATLYAQTKGAGRHSFGNHAVRAWAGAQYATLLDHWPAVRDVLATRPLAGSFLKLGRGWPAEVPQSQWHYSGSWFWCRNADLFDRPFGRPDHPHAAEFWPSLHWPVEDAGVVFHSAPVAQMDLYDGGTWDRLRPALDAWEARHRRQRTPADLLAGSPCRLELGGGRFGREEFYNLDREPSEGVDYLVDLSELPWPVQDDSVDAFYSSHWLEHMAAPMALLHEVVRCGKVGCTVEVAVPHPLGPMAMVYDHRHVFSPQCAVNAEEHFPRDFWRGPKRLRLDRIGYGPVVGGIEGARRDLPFLAGLSDEAVMRWVPGTCHESRFFWTVVENEYA